MDFSNYKFRAHSVGQIMGGLPKPLTPKQEELFKDYTERKNGVGRSLSNKQLAEWGSLYTKKTAKPKLTDGAKKYLEELVWQTLTNRSKKLQAKYLDKGIQCEEKSFTLHSEVVNTLFTKNLERKENEYFSGECDNAQNKVIRDIKTSWEYSTFPLRENAIPSSIYEWQLDVYMDLWEFKDSELVYCLVDTPFKLIKDEIRRFDWKHNILDNEGNVREESIDLVVEIVSNHIYTNEGLEKFCADSLTVNLDWFVGKFKEIPKEIRVKIFEHKYCENRNKQLKEMIGLARVFMNSIIKDLGESVHKLSNYKL